MDALLSARPVVNPSEATLEEPGPGTRDHFQNIAQDKDTGYTEYGLYTLSNRPCPESALPIAQ